jgi:hypothetical protein
MNRRDLLEALAEAEAEFARRQVWGFGPDGFGPYSPEVLRRSTALDTPERPAKPRWTGRPRRNSKQVRRERGEI